MEQQTSAASSAPLDPAAFDPFDEPYQDDPALALAWSRSDVPVFWSNAAEAWIVTSHELVKAAFEDAETFSAANVLDPQQRPCRDALRVLARHRFQGAPVMANEGGRTHQRRRQLLTEPLMRKETDRHEPAIRELARQHIAALRPAGEGDLMSGVLWPVPALVLLRVLGVPDAYTEQAMEFMISLAGFTWGRPSEAEEVTYATSLGRYWGLTETLLEWWRDHPSAPGLMPHAVRAAEEAPDLVDDLYLRRLMMNLTAAGHETVSNAGGNAVRSLMATSGGWASLVEEPSRASAIVDECLRHRPAVAAWRRRTTTATQLGDVEIPADAAVLLVIASANHDERVFADPRAVRVDRPNVSQQLSFGHGQHTCVGQPLAKLQLRVLLQELATGLPDLEPMSCPIERHAANVAFHGPATIPARWSPT